MKNRFFANDVFPGNHKIKQEGKDGVALLNSLHPNFDYSIIIESDNLKNTINADTTTGE